jgi:hypothetical protein
LFTSIDVVRFFILFAIWIADARKIGGFVALRIWFREICEFRLAFSINHEISIAWFIEDSPQKQTTVKEKKRNNTMSDVTREIALRTARHTDKTFGDLLSMAEGDDPVAAAKANALLHHLLSVPLREICMLGGPDARITDAQISDLRKKVIANTMRGSAPVEKTVSEIVSAIAGNDPQARANVSYVIDLMRAPPAKGRGDKIKGYGDLVAGSGERRSQAYYPTADAAQRFGFSYDAAKLIPRPVKTAGKKIGTSDDIMNLWFREICEFRLAFSINHEIIKSRDLLRILLKNRQKEKEKKKEKKMFRDDFYFMTRSQLNSWNRVNRAPGAKYPTDADYQRVNSMIDIVGDEDILRTESGVIPVTMCDE